VTGGPVECEADVEQSCGARDGAALGHRFVAVGLAVRRLGRRP